MLATCPTNQILVPATKFFDEMGSSHKGTWSLELVAGTNRRDLSLRVCRPLLFFLPYPVPGTHVH